MITKTNKVVAIPFAPMPVEQNPNIKKTSRGLELYLEASFVAFASFGRWNPEWRKVFVTTVEPSLFWREKYRSIDVEIVVTDFLHEPPEGFSKTFAGSLFILDALYLFKDFDYTLFIDPDVLAIGCVDSLTAHNGSIAALELPTPRDEKINGLSLNESVAVYTRRGVTSVEPRHFGGELYGIPASLRENMLTQAERGWAGAIADYSNGLGYFTTEEHILGFAISNLPTFDAGHLIQRIWTAHSYRTVTGRESLLSLWHLPAEKQRSFQKLYRLSQNPESWFWVCSQKDFIRRSAKLAGFHSRSPLRFTVDLFGKIYRKYKESK